MYDIYNGSVREHVPDMRTKYTFRIRTQNVAKAEFSKMKNRFKIVVLKMEIFKLMKEKKDDKTVIIFDSNQPI